MLRQKRKNKFNAKKDFRCADCGSSAIYAGTCHHCKSIQVIKFDSKAEARRYDKLLSLQKEGVISGLRCQVKYPLRFEKIHIGNYIGDFEYCKDGNIITEDAKGVETALFRWKARHFAAQYGRIVKVVR